MREVGELAIVYPPVGIRAEPYAMFMLAILAGSIRGHDFRVSPGGPHAQHLRVRRPRIHGRRRAAPALGQTGNLLGLANRGTGRQLVVHGLWLTLHGSGHIDQRAVAVSAAAVILAGAARKLVAKYSLPLTES